VTRLNSSSTRTGRRATETIFADAASGRVIQAGAPHDIVDLVVKVVQPDHWEVLCTQRMVAVVDRNFSRALLMGSMSFTCSRR
jgi:hypothetical protein